MCKLAQFTACKLLLLVLCKTQGDEVKGEFESPFSACVL